MNIFYRTGMGILPWAITILIGVIFLLDLLTPMGVVVSVLYVIPLTWTFLSSRHRDPLYVCLIATGLLWAGLFLKPAGLFLEYAVLNRILGTFVLWLIAIGLVQYKKTQSSLVNAETRQIQAVRDRMSERIERSHAEGLMTAAQEARADAETASSEALTSRQETEKKYLITQLRLEGIIQSAMDAIITVDDEQKVLLFNHAAEHMFQCSAADALGKPLDRFIPPRYRTAHRRHVEEFRRSLITTRKIGRLGQVRGLRADGTEFPAEAAISHMDVEGKTFLTVILRDITEREHLNAQLRNTERLAELGTLASGMAHEIGTPMNVILGRAEYLMDRVQEEPIRKGLQTIIVQVERITKVMNQLLALVRPKNQERVPVDLREVIESSLEMFQERLTNAQVKVNVDAEDPCPKILADADQMSQVLINLIMNAIHAMPQGGTLHIRLAHEPHFVKLTVADTGHGMPADVMTKIFSPLFTTKEFGKGTGLGLTVVKGIIEEHRGSIAVESEEGRGTTFTVLLPTHQEDSDSAAAAVSVSA